jgi:hypothetical protein
VAPYVSQAARLFAALAPHELREGFHRSYVNAKAFWDEKRKNGTHTERDAERKQ